MTPELTRFAPQSVPLRQWPVVLREAVDLVAAAPWRLLGLYLLVYLPIQLIDGVAYMAMPVRAAAMTLGFSGLFVAMDRVRAGAKPGLRDMFAPWQLPWNKIGLLTLSGALGAMLIWTIWLADLGSAQLAQILARAFSETGAPVPSAADPGLGLRLEAAVVDNLVAIPLLVLQPICVRYSWSAGRSLAATLVLGMRNAAWGLAFAAVLIPATMAMYVFPVDNLIDVFLLIGMDLVLGLITSAVCLVVLDRSLALPPPGASLIDPS